MAHIHSAIGRFLHHEPSIIPPFNVYIPFEIQTQLKAIKLPLVRKQGRQRLLSVDKIDVGREIAVQPLQRYPKCSGILKGESDCIVIDMDTQSGEMFNKEVTGNLPLGSPNSFEAVFCQLPQAECFT